MSAIHGHRISNIRGAASEISRVDQLSRGIEFSNKGILETVQRPLNRVECRKIGGGRVANYIGVTHWLHENAVSMIVITRVATTKERRKQKR